jgi:hypothetical protein
LKFLLDENFPLQLYRRLLDEGHSAEHVIVLGQRGASDLVLRERLVAEDLVFLTQDTEFETPLPGCRSRVIISRVPQRLSIGERVEIWLGALERFVRENPSETIFELLPSGEIAAWTFEKSPDGITAGRVTRRI